jgi:excinuclease ABC subunit B
VAEGYNKKPEKTDITEYLNIKSKEEVIILLTKEMKKAAAELDFEKAAELRDRIFELKES